MGGMSLTISSFRCPEFTLTFGIHANATQAAKSMQALTFTHFLKMMSALVFLVVLISSYVDSFPLDNSELNEEPSRDYGKRTLHI